MSSGRYPKRRRVSEKARELTPQPESPAVPDGSPAPEPEPERRPYNSSPDELAAIPDHSESNGRRRGSQPNRAPSRPKRARKGARKSTSEISAPLETDPNQQLLEDDIQEASPDELDASPPTPLGSVARANTQQCGIEATDSEAILLQTNAGAGAMGYRNTPESPAISPLSTFDNPEEPPDTASLSALQDASEEISDESPIAKADDGADDLATGHTNDHEIPKLIRSDTNTVYQFRGSFSQAVPRPSDDRYISASPPPYSRISTPIATPRELPARPPQYLPYKQKMVLKGHKRGVAAVRFSPNGRLIASCSADATIRIWDTATGKHLHTLEGHLAGISIIAWSPDSKTLASGSDDKSIRLWDVETGKAHPHPLQSHSSYVYALSFSPRGNILASGSYDEALFLWDVRTTRIMRSLPAHSDPIGGVDFIHDGTLIVSCSGDGLIRIWDTATGQCLRTLVHEDNAAVTSVRFSPNGNYVLAWTLDSSVRLWNYKEGRCVKTYQGHKNEKYSLSGAFGVYQNEDKTEERAFVVSGSEDGEIFVWDVQSKEILQTMPGHEGVVLGVDTCKQDGLLVSGGLDKTVRMWARDDGVEEKEKEAGRQEDEVVVNGAVEDGDEVMVNGEVHDHMVVNGEPDPMDLDVVKEIEEHIVNTA